MKAACSLATAIILAASATVLVPPRPLLATSAIPTQWIAQQYTEALGRAPTPTDWSVSVDYYSTNGCTATTLAFLAKELLKNNSDFLTAYPEATDKRSRVLALIRAAYHREPSASDWAARFDPYNAGTSTWNQIVDDVFSAAEFTTTIGDLVCSTGTPTYGFNEANQALEVNSSASRTQAALQGALEAAALACGTVSLNPREVVRVGGNQPGFDADNQQLVIPACVTLTTTGSPNARAYARMGRIVRNGSSALVCDGFICDRASIVKLESGAKLQSVWVDGKGSAGAARKQAVVATVGSTAELPTSVLNNRVSDPPEHGVAIRAAGFGTTGVPCSGENISANLITGYSSRHEQTPVGNGKWVDGIAVYCESALVAFNHLVDVSGRGIMLYGVRHRDTPDGRDRFDQVYDPACLSGPNRDDCPPRIGIANLTQAGHTMLAQVSDVRANRVIAAGNSAHVALGADAVGECNDYKQRPHVTHACIDLPASRPGPKLGDPRTTQWQDFAGASIEMNSFWTGDRTHFDVGILVGGKPYLGALGGSGTGISVTRNTVPAGATARTNVGIAISGMYDVQLKDNTSTYTLVQTNPGISEPALRCEAVDIGLQLYLGNTTSDSNNDFVAASLNGCMTPHPPPGGLDFIRAKDDGSGFEGATSGELLTPFGSIAWNPTGHSIGDYTETEFQKIIKDMRQLKQMGVNAVRLVLQLQPELLFDDPNCTVVTNTLDQLERVIRIARDLGLYVDITGLDSKGDQFDPDCYRDVSDAVRWDRHNQFWLAVAARLEPYSNIFAFSLAGEQRIAPPQNPPDPDSPATWDVACVGGFDPYCVQYLTKNTANSSDVEDIGFDWTGRLRDTIRQDAGDLRHMITYGLIIQFDQPDQTPNTGLGPNESRQGNYVHNLDFVAAHSYGVNGVATEIDRFSALVAANPSKPVIIEETSFAAFGDFEDFISQTRTAGVSGWFTFAGGETPTQMSLTPAQVVASLSTNPGTFGERLATILGGLNGRQFVLSQGQRYAPCGACLL